MGFKIKEYYVLWRNIKTDEIRAIQGNEENRIREGRKLIRFRERVKTKRLKKKINKKLNLLFQVENFQ